MIVLLYAVAGVRLPENVSFHPFGISFVIDRAILEWGLVLISLYAAIRYWLNSVKKVLPPWRARKLLEEGQYGPIEEVKNVGLRVRDIGLRFLPGMKEPCSIVKRLDDGTGMVGASGGGKRPWPTNLLIWMDNLDYTLPVWFNGLAILLFLISWASHG